MEKTILFLGGFTFDYTQSPKSQFPFSGTVVCFSSHLVTHHTCRIYIPNDGITDCHLFSVIYQLPTNIKILQNAVHR